MQFLPFEFSYCFALLGLLVLRIRHGPKTCWMTGTTHIISTCFAFPEYCVLSLLMVFQNFPSRTVFPLFASPPCCLLLVLQPHPVLRNPLFSFFFKNFLLFRTHSHRIFSSVFLFFFFLPSLSNSLSLYLLIYFFIFSSFLTSSRPLHFFQVTFIFFFVSTCFVAFEYFRVPFVSLLYVLHSNSKFQFCVKSPIHFNQMALCFPFTSVSFNGTLSFFHFFYPSCLLHFVFSFSFALFYSQHLLFSFVLLLHLFLPPVFSTTLTYFPPLQFFF
jgi:hypothetical protein